MLRLADNALVLGQRNAEWCGHGPVLEEDIALANISLDLIGQARLLYGRAGALEGELTGRACQEDDYAYWRAERAIPQLDCWSCRTGAAGRYRQRRPRLRRHHRAQLPLQRADGRALEPPRSQRRRRTPPSPPNR